MADPATVPLVFVRHDDETVVLDIDSDNAGTAVNITGRTYTMTVGTITANGSVSGAAGEVTFSFTQANTEELTASSYPYYIIETASDAESTLVNGRITVKGRDLS